MKSDFFSKTCKVFTTAFLLAFCCLNFLAQTVRSVKGRVLTSTASPDIRLKFDKKLKFVGSQKFVLYGRVDAEQYFFVEAENKVIKRLFMLQFESFLPEIDAKYEYNEPNSAEIGGFKYFSNSENIADTEAALKAVPDSGIAKAAKFLQDKGFVLMKSLKYQRFVRVLGDAKRSEFILLYVEENDESSTKTGDLQSRALANFKVLK